MKIRAMIVDDEPLAREGIRLRLATEADVEVVGEHATALEAIDAIAREAPDLLFLDVQMPGMNGLQMLRRIGPDRVPAVVLVTAHEEHALAAFDASVTDYLLKPVDQERFTRALERSRARLRTIRAMTVVSQLRDLVGPLVDHEAEPQPASLPESEPRAPGQLSFLLVPTASGEQLVRVSEVDWIEATRDYVTLHCGGRRHLLLETISGLERLLDPQSFCRIHRSTIVRLDRVRELRRTMHGDAEVLLEDGSRLRVSRSYRERFREALLSSRESR